MLKALHTASETTSERSRAGSPTIETIILRCLEAQSRPIGRSGLKDRRKCKPLPVSYIRLYGVSVVKIRVMQGEVKICGVLGSKIGLELGRD